MTPTRDDVLALARSLFDEPAMADVLKILAAYGTEHHEREVQRVQMAILELSRGDRGKLPDLVRAAKSDYRDVLAWQQQGPLSPAVGSAWQAAARALIDRWGRK